MFAWYLGMSAENQYLHNFRENIHFSLTESNSMKIRDLQIDTSPSPNDFFALEMIKVDENGAIQIPTDLNRTPGIGIYFTSLEEKTPVVFKRMISRVRSLPEIIVFLCVDALSIPSVSNEDRVLIEKHDNYYRVIIRCGYTENHLHLVDILTKAESIGFPHFHDGQLTLYALRTHPITMSTFIPKFIVFKYYTILKRILSSGSTNISANFEVPIEETVEIGIIIPL